MTSLDTGAETIAQNIDRLAAATLEKRPAMETVVRPFAAVFTVKALLVEKIAPELAARGFDFDYDRLAAGAPLMTSLSIDRLEKFLDLAFKTLMPALKDSFPSMDGECYRLEQAHDRGDLDLVRLAGDFLEGNQKKFEKDARLKNVSPGCLGFIVNFTLSTVLQAMARPLNSRPGLAAWKKGYCPICGSLPSIGFLAKASTKGAEYLQGGGGQKYLHCALCGHDWRINRNVCPACDNDDKDQKYYLQVQEEKAERVDICRKCGLYLLCLDTRQSFLIPHLDLTSVGMLHLEILAREKGFHPMTWTPWNRME